MRSSSVCWMLGLCGFNASTLDGGYRSFRRWVQALMRSTPPEAAPKSDAQAAAACGVTDVIAQRRTHAHGERAVA